MPRPIFFTKPAPTLLSYPCRRLTRARVRHFIGKMSTLCTFCIHCVDNQSFQECRQIRFLSTLLSTHCHYHITLCLHLSAPYPLCYMLIVGGAAKQLWEVVISVAPNGTPASRNRHSAYKLRADTVLNGVQVSCRQSADEYSCVQMMSTLLKRLIINAVHTKSVECIQNDEITKTVCGPFGIIMRLLKKPTRDASPPLERNFPV